MQRDRPRTFDAILKNLAALNTQGLLPDVESVMGFRDKDSEDEITMKE